MKIRPDNEIGSRKWVRELMACLVTPDHAPAFAGKNRHAAEGERIVREYGTARWMMHNGGTLALVEQRLKDLREEKLYLDQRLRIARARRDAEPTWIRRNVMQGARNGVEALKDLVFGKWNLWDKIVCLSAGTMGTLLLALGHINVATILTQPGNLVFADKPWAAWLVGALVPSSAMALKMVHWQFDEKRHARLFAWTVQSVAGLSAALWIVLFSMAFDGVSSEIDWGDIGEEASGNSLSVWLTMVQIFAEATIGAALFLTVADCFDRYSARWSVKNIKRIEAERIVQTTANEQLSNSEAIAEADYVLNAFNWARTAFVEEAVADWRALQGGKSS